MTAAHVDCSIDNLKGSATTTGHTTLRGLAHPLLAGTCSSVLRRAVLGVTAGHCRRLTHPLLLLIGGSALLPTRQAALLLVVLLLIGSVRGVLG